MLPIFTAGELLNNNQGSIGKQGGLFVGKAPALMGIPKRYSIRSRDLFASLPLRQAQGPPQGLQGQLVGFLPIADPPAASRSGDVTGIRIEDVRSQRPRFDSSWAPSFADLRF